MSRSPHDVFTPDERSRVMRAVKDKNTKPEMIVRRMAHALGYRYRLHRKDLPGSPDLVFAGRKAVIFVHGCFWHGHDCKRGSRQPKTNAEYWRAKIARNMSRDAANLQALENQGWRALVLWECELKDRAAMAERLRGFLG
ncbi:very short patch repair endonuclease [Oceanicaulis sp.]|uniref:very short patch repair endonuclease n=1 Tax=Oceanicaulis sp. TaxID=1924941 RepID=UPI003D2D1F1E